MKSVRLLSYLLGIFASAAVASAQITVVNDGFANGDNWGTSVLTVPTVIGGAAGTSTGALTIAGGRVDFTATMSAQDGAMVQVAQPWSFTAPSNSNWSISIDATNAFAAAPQQTVQVGLFVSNTAGLSWSSTPPSTHDYVKLVLQSKSTGMEIHGGLHLNGAPASALSGQVNPNTVSVGSTTSGTLVFSYNASTSVITSGYNFGGTLYEFGSYGVTGSGGTTANANWAMSGGTFTVSLFGQGFGSSFNVTSGTAFLDNFGTSTSTTSMTAVPEPSTYAALAGLCALGVAVWRRRSLACSR